jgi:3-methyladenine DNA glycosylase AlkC
MVSTDHNNTTELELETLTKYLIVEKPNVATQRKIAEQVIEKLNLEVVYHYLKMLSEDKNWICRNLSCYILPFCFQSIEDKKEIMEILFKLADDKDWRVRESAAWSFYKLLKNNFETIYPLFIDWSSHSNENVRRATIIAAMKMAKHREENHAKHLLGLIELFLNDRSNYVQKAIIFAIGDGFLRYYPSYIFTYLKSWAKSSEIQLRWIVVMSLSMAEARRHIKECMEILRELSFDDAKLVQNVVVKALTNLAQKYPEKVYEEIKMWGNNPNRDYIVNKVLQKKDK